MKSKNIFKRAAILALAVISIVTALAFAPSKVLASGETYTWVDYNTIKVSGGDLSEGAELKLVQGSDPQRFVAEVQPTHEDGCKLSLTLTLVDDNSAKISVPEPKDQTSIGNSDEQYCNDPEYETTCSGWGWWKECTKQFVGAKFPGIYEDYNGKTVTIQGTRPGSDDQTETEIQKRASITINSPNPANASPDSINIQIKNLDGTVLYTANAVQEPALGSDDPTDQNYLEPDFRPVQYFNRFILEPGKYLVCADIVIPDCREFEKVKFEPFSKEYGETSDERSITAKITVGYIGAPQDMTVGPLEVDLYRPDNSVIAVQTNEREHKMTSEEEQADGLITVEYTFGLEAVFNDMDPATYKVCIVGLEECKDVVKQSGESAIVEFTIDWNDFNEEDEYERDCTEKYEVMGTKAITFLVCPIIDTTTYAVGQLDSVISDLLTVDVNDIFNDNDTSNAFHKAWNSFRMFALGLIVIAALIMVVSQASGLDFVDAYTVKKVLPRLLFAAIFVTLSWDIMEFLTTLSNDAGTGIRSLIYAPFKSISSEAVNIAGGSLLVLTLISAGAALMFGFMGLLSFVLTGLLASLIAFSVIVIRKLLIIVLVIMSPFAIASYVLPNTSKAWDFWKTSLMSVLIVFPIIMAFIAIGRVSSATALIAPGNQTINQLIAIVMYFAPYFMIMFAFRMAGGVLAKIGGLANDTGRGGFDRLKNFRSNVVKQRGERMGNGDLFQNNNPLARAFNATTFGATTFAKARNKRAFLTDSNVRRATFEQQRSLNAMRYAQTDEAKASEENDLALQAQTYGGEEETREKIAQEFGMMSENDSGDGQYDKDEAGNYQYVGSGGRYDVDQATVDDAVAAAKANGGWSRNKQLYAARALFATGTGYRTLKQVHTTLRRVAGNNEALARAILGYGNSKAGGTDRLDFKEGFNEQMKLYREMRDTGDLSIERLDRSIMEAVRGVDPYTMSRGGRQMVMENVMPVIERTLHRQQILAGSQGVLRHDNGKILNDRGLTVQQAAREEVGRLTGLLQRYEQTVLRVASPATMQQINEMALAPSAGVRAAATRRAQVRNVVADPATGRPVMVDNPHYNEDISRGYQQQAPRTPGIRRNGNP